MENYPTKSLHALYLYFGANLILFVIDAPGWTFFIATAVLLWWILRWE